ncbi:DUF2274 domain-containing protein [Methylocella tundrae]|uniref:DUF2274 domain-containing protein n=1 Tax=Methylocella tundrae TaxID=227605 RepID=UPI00157B078E|nr:DUF2274 domain-containing protein [Methylocella tundrae]
MGQFSAEKPGLPGSVLSGNRHAKLIAPMIKCFMTTDRAFAKLRRGEPIQSSSAGAPGADRSG